MSDYYQTFHSPIGLIYIGTDGQSIKVLAIGENWQRLKNKLTDRQEKEHPILSQSKQQLTEYFDQQRTDFDLPLHFGGTPFQNLAWQALLQVPYGETSTYGQQAVVIGKPKAVRAIGRANGLNPISIIVPCHRIIGQSGKLTGYASGLANKAYLLNLEQCGGVGQGRKSGAGWDSTN